MSMSKGLVLIVAFSAFWGCAAALNVLLYGFSFGSTPGPFGISIAVIGGLLEVIAGLFVLDRFAPSPADKIATARHPDFAPQPAVPPWARYSVPATVFSVAAAAVALLVYFQLSSPRPVEMPSGDSVAANPELYLKNKPPQLTMNGQEFVLLKGQTVTFESSHPAPLKYQWLLHIAGPAKPVEYQQPWPPRITGSVKLVASAGKTEKLSYPLRQFDSNWGGTDSRYEFLVIVTAAKLRPGWPENVTSPIELEGLFTEGDLRELQVAAREPDPEKRNVALKRVLRLAFDRRFGSNQCWFEVYVYHSENRE